MKNDYWEKLKEKFREDNYRLITDPDTREPSTVDFLLSLELFAYENGLTYNKDYIRTNYKVILTKEKESKSYIETLDHTEIEENVVIYVGETFRSRLNYDNDFDDKKGYFITYNGNGHLTINKIKDIVDNNKEDIDCLKEIRSEIAKYIRDRKIESKQSNFISVPSKLIIRLDEVVNKSTIEDFNKDIEKVLMDKE